MNLLITAEGAPNSSSHLLIDGVIFVRHTEAPSETLYLLLLYDLPDLYLCKYWWWRL